MHISLGWCGMYYADFNGKTESYQQKFPLQQPIIKSRAYVIIAILGYTTHFCQAVGHLIKLNYQ